MLDFSSQTVLIPWLVTLIALIVASICDLRTREVPDWISYSLIAFGIAFSIIVSLLEQTMYPTLFSLAGLLICIGIAYLMYYAGQWGGGDAKLLMGIGAVMGINVFNILHMTFFNIPFLFDFFLDILLAGAIYGLIWTSVLAIKKWKTFKPAFSDLLKTKPIRIVRITALSSSLLLFVIALLASSVRLVAFILGLLIYCFFYLWVFVKAIEKSCMIKEVLPEKLTEGDWILYDIVIDGKRICGPKDLGVSKEQISQLILLKKKKKLSTVMIKEGVPFVPSFLIAFLLASFLPVWYFMMLG
jgi:Flp pilus assembly protein protease CpaA